MRFDNINEGVAKIACVKCDEVSTAKAWEKNNGFCPKCKTSSQGVAESEDTRMGTITVTSDEERKRRAKAYRDKKLKEADGEGTYARVSYEYSEDWGSIDLYKNHNKVAEWDGYFGANETGNPLARKFVEMCKEHGFDPMKLQLVDENGDIGKFDGKTFKWDVEEARRSSYEVFRSAQAKERNKKYKAPTQEDFQKGDTVKPTKGPHKGHPHEVIHDFGDGHYNIKPKWLNPNQIKYSLGAARAHKSDLVKEEVELDEVTNSVKDQLANIDLSIRDWERRWQNSSADNPNDMKAPQKIKDLKAQKAALMKKHGIKEEVAQVDKKENPVKEAKLSSEQRDRLDDLIYDLRYLTMPHNDWDDFDNVEAARNVIDNIRSEFGNKVADQIEKGAEEIWHGYRPNSKANIGRDNLSNRKSTRITKSGKANKTDIASLKREIQIDKGSFAKDSKRLPESDNVKESLTLDYSRYMRSHGKKPRPGSCVWMFTTTDMGEPAEDDVFQFSGNLADAKRAAAKWARGKGAYRFYVMEKTVTEDDCQCANGETTQEQLLDMLENAMISIEQDLESGKLMDAHQLALGEQYLVYDALYNKISSGADLGESANQKLDEIDWGTVGNIAMTAAPLLIPGVGVGALAGLAGRAALGALAKRGGTALVKRGLEKVAPNLMKRLGQTKAGRAATTAGGQAAVGVLNPAADGPDVDRPDSGAGQDLLGLAAKSGLSSTDLELVKKAVAARK